MKKKRQDRRLKTRDKIEEEETGQKMEDKRQDEEEETGQKMEDKRQDEEEETGQKMGRQEKIREKTRREKKQDNCVFFFKITGPSNNFEFSKLPLPTLKEFNFSGNFVFVRLQIKIIFELFG